MINKFKNIEFIDFSEFPLTDEQFADFGHLNHTGALKFSKWFDKLLQKGLMSTEDKAMFVQKEIEKIKSSKKL